MQRLRKTHERSDPSRPSSIGEHAPLASYKDCCTPATLRFMSHVFIHKFPENDTPYPLSRHIEHDSRSRHFAFEGVAAGVSVTWPHNTPVLNQGNVGSCTGNAMAQLLNCRMFAPCRLGKISLNESDALHLYSIATHEDGFGPSQYYPPHDEGSSGLGVAKAATYLGYIDSYRHCFTLSQLQAAIETQPVITGTSWTNSMFQPDPKTGFVSVGPLNDSTVAGGHEYLIQGIEYNNKAIVCLNSWGTSWGGGDGLTPGQFRISFNDYESLLADQGDIIVPQSKKV